MTDGRTPPTDDGEPTYAPECYACPIGTVFMTFQGARPEATEHLLRAGKELLAAMRALLDGASQFLEETERRGPARVEKITVRRRPPADA